MPRKPRAPAAAPSPTVRAVYRGRSGALFVGGVKFLRDGAAHEIPRELFERLTADPTVWLEEVPERPAPAAAPDDENAGDAGDESPAEGAGDEEVSTDG